MSRPFEDIVRERLSRRSLLAGAAAAGLLFATRPAGARDAPASASFRPIALSDADKLIVPHGYAWHPVLRWGDPLVPGAPAFDPRALTAASQSTQMGYNCDYVGFIPLPHGVRSPRRGLLCVSSEYTLPQLMWRGGDPRTFSREQCDVDMAAHGLNVAEVQTDRRGHWQLVARSPRNRRVTPFTPTRLSGPAAGHARLRTTQDPTGTRVLGTFANCAGNITPWGTWLQAEENIEEYFGGDPSKADDLTAADIALFGVRAQSWHAWERHHPRFDLNREPNEFNRFGWIVETDPHDPSSTPVKRTALGRFEHEAATIALSETRRVVAYMGDDARFECIYKFVSRDAYRPGHKAHNRALLDHGTLYVARFENDGRGTWIPLIHGADKLQPSDGFASQADILIRTREAAKAVGGTPMDRPEDIAVHPDTGAIYVALTNNTRRKPTQTDGPNPRGPNKYGHILELRERDGDVTGTHFTWEVFLLGQASEAGAPHILSCPDNLAFDPSGDLWVATDGQPATLGKNDGVYRVATSGPMRGIAQRFLSAVPGAEVCGPAFTPDARTFFCAIQHPGQGSSWDSPSTRFPDYDPAMPPRPTVIAVQRDDGGPIGT